MNEVIYSFSWAFWSQSDDLHLPGGSIQRLNPKFSQSRNIHPHSKDAKAFGPRVEICSLMAEYILIILPKCISKSKLAYLEVLSDSVCLWKKLNLHDWTVHDNGRVQMPRHKQLLYSEKQELLAESLVMAPSHLLSPSFHNSQNSYPPYIYSISLTVTYSFRPSWNCQQVSESPPKSAVSQKHREWD